MRDLQANPVAPGPKRPPPVHDMAELEKNRQIMKDLIGQAKVLIRPKLMIGLATVEDVEGANNILRLFNTPEAELLTFPPPEDPEEFTTGLLDKSAERIADQVVNAWMEANRVALEEKAPGPVDVVFTGVPGKQDINGSRQLIANTCLANIPDSYAHLAYTLDNQTATLQHLAHQLVNQAGKSYELPFGMLLERGAGTHWTVRKQ